MIGKSLIPKDRRKVGVGGYQGARLATGQTHLEHRKLSH